MSWKIVVDSEECKRRHPKGMDFDRREIVYTCRGTNIECMEETCPLRKEAKDAE